ncbi:MAG: hypothetical protein DWQ31_20705 [Planctomycetota bacterium]|nr:MAG: hypothetical protein DWQ31_20705 [Planctomycetota bacterium]REJ96710.1 MAG: hypothetical protein DWQ35_03835 [Planctomycetota bacterium]REK22311.1 MAG: hypothetical protein DWQ42_17375 [Planctomycetota bacterium]REK41062.1 MAG: hypothetical protein DWQ46_14560 [Planctomycetota bacterium]
MNETTLPEVPFDSLPAAGMPTSSSANPSGAAPAAPEKVQLVDEIEGLLTNLIPLDPPIERRGERRYPYPALLRVLPYDESTGQVDAANFDSASAKVVVGHHLSLHGIGFFHREPLADRHVIVEFPEARQGEPLRVLVKLKWCRFAREGWYESGGRMIREM